jgi:hypothetical protein
MKAQSKRKKSKALKNDEKAVTPEAKKKKTNVNSN